MADRSVLVAGASGLIGHAALEQFVRDGGWDVIGVSRSVPDDVPGATVVALDLTDPAACRRVLAQVGGVTHLVYAALQEGPGLLPGWYEDELMERNAAMLRNLLDALDLGALQHVSLLQGTKAYGVHHPSVGPERVPMPLRERAPRVEHPNFYWLQEDELRARQAGAGWGLTMFRPTVVYGATGHVNMNPLPAIAAYAALQRAAGEPLHFPGTETGRTLREAVDADLVARALVWAATSPSAAAARSTSRTATSSAGRPCGRRSPRRSAWSSASTGRCPSPPTCPPATPSGRRSSPATTSPCRRASRASSAPTRSSTPMS